MNKLNSSMLGGEQASRSSYDVTALKALYLRYRTPLTKWLIKSYAVDVNEAIELTQSAFAIFVEKSVSGSLPPFQKDSNIKSYLFAIAKNKAREQRRFKQKTMSLVEGQMVEEQDPSAEEEKKQNIRLATTAFKQLGEKCQQLLKLAIVLKLSMKEIAIQMNYENTNTAKNLKYKCLLKLRKLYTQLA